MNQILNRVHNVDGSDSEAVKEALSGFFQNLLKHKQIDCYQWLLALENVINRFPKYCGTHRPTIESYLSHFLSSNNYYNVIEAAKCAHAVQQVRPAQEKAATARSCWRDQMITLCDAAHKLIDALFTNNDGMYHYQSNQSDIAKSTSPLQDMLSHIDSLAGEQENAANKTTILCTRLTNVMVFMQAMLVEIYPVAKPIQPQLILEVVLQALSASGSEDSHNVTNIKIQALRTVDALVLCLGSNLIPFSALVFRFVMRTLKWSSENPSEETRKVRIAAYASLANWLDCLHVHRPMPSGRTRAWHDELTTHIVNDVTPTLRVMQLTVNAQPMKNLSKKARKRLANTMMKDSSMASHMPGGKKTTVLSDESSDEVAVAALECAQTFLLVCGIFLNNTTHKQFQELLVRECFAIDSDSPRTMPLLHALEACRKSCPSKVPPPTQYCLQLYSVLINSTREISKFCSSALLDIRLHLHCAPSSLNFAIDESSRRKEKEDGKKRVSDRNKAALENLLGNDWMNLPNIDTIVIPDEPASKRPRQSDSAITDNVSISSESVQSIDSDESITDAVELLEDSPVGILNEPTQSNIPCDELDTVNNDSSVIDNGRRLAIDNNRENDLTIDENGKIGLTVNNDNDSDLTTENNDQHNESDVTVDIESDLTLHSKPTQVIAHTDKLDEILVIDEVADTKVEKTLVTTSSQANSLQDINGAKAQLPNCDGDKSPLAIEIVCDDASTHKETATVLENLPSTDETDDIHITCEQVVKYSPDSEKRDEIEIPKVNGIDKSLSDNEAANDVSPKDSITVEDMLADFVDEPNEIQAVVA